MTDCIREERREENRRGIGPLPIGGRSTNCKYIQIYIGHTESDHERVAESFHVRGAARLTYHKRGETKIKI